MQDTPYLYQDRAVVFLDVLGFQERLKEFQDEAIRNKEENNTEYYISRGVNDFIDTFKSVVAYLDENNYNYYLFSDNICITIDFSENQNRLIEILITINELFFRFAQKGYFLRGALDVGKFVDEKDIAIGVPLANAYKIERDVALFPRIVLSKEYKVLLDKYEESNSISDDSAIKKNYLIKQHCEIFYTNIFFNLVNNENKIELLESLNHSISKALKDSSLNERIAIKYEWLIREFNAFIDEYLNELMFLETDYPPNEEETEKIKSLKFTDYV